MVSREQYFFKRQGDFLVDRTVDPNIIDAKNQLLYFQRNLEALFPMSRETFFCNSIEEIISAVMFQQQGRNCARMSKNSSL